MKVIMEMYHWNHKFEHLISIIHKEFYLHLVRMKRKWRQHLVVILFQFSYCIPLYKTLAINPTFPCVEIFILRNIYFTKSLVFQNLYF